MPEDTGTHAGHELNLPLDNVDKVGVREQRQNSMCRVRNRGAQSTQPDGSPTMPAKTVTAQARPDPMPVAGQRPGPPFFAILIVAGLIVIGAGLRSIANIVGPLFLVITLVITVAPLRNLLVRRRWPSWLASVVSLLTIYALLGLILGSVASQSPGWWGSYPSMRPRSIRHLGGAGIRHKLHPKHWLHLRCDSAGPHRSA
jgi:hypothetical protein